MTRRIAVLTVFSLGLTLSLMAPPAGAEDNNIVTTAVEAGRFNTLVKAVQAAGLEEALAGGGPFTVFAPTDEAFAKLPEGTLESLLEDTEALTAILTYHVVPGRKLAADVVAADSLNTLNGNSAHVVVSDGVVEIAGAVVVQTDIDAGNGVIHVIDTVMLPPTE